MFYFNSFKEFFLNIEMEENIKDNVLKENIKKILENIKKYNNNKYNKPFIEWIEQITDPKFFLISDIMNYFLDELTSYELKEAVLLLLQKLFELKKENIISQIMYNNEFIKGLIDYVNTNEKKNLSESSFYILCHLYNEKNFEKSYLCEDYISTLFYGINYVHDNILLNEIIDILLNIHFKFKVEDRNFFLEVHIDHPCSRVLNEILLRIIIDEEDKKRLHRILKCLNDIMDNEITSIFCKGDIEIFIDVCRKNMIIVFRIKIFIDVLIGQLQSNISTDLTIDLLNSLERVTLYDEYYDSLYKVDDITELMEDFEVNVEQHSEIRKISKQIVINITDHQGKHNEMRN